VQSFCGLSLILGICFSIGNLYLFFLKKMSSFSTAGWIFSIIPGVGLIVLSIIALIYVNTPRVKALLNWNCYRPNSDRIGCRIKTVWKSYDEKGVTELRLSIGEDFSQHDHINWPFWQYHRGISRINFPQPIIDGLMSWGIFLSTGCDFRSNRLSKNRCGCRFLRRERPGRINEGASPHLGTGHF